MKRANKYQIILLVTIAISGAIIGGSVYSKYRNEERDRRIYQNTMQEARNSLNSIHRLQEEYYIRNGDYSSNLSLIGFTLAGQETCQYIVETNSEGESPAYVARAFCEYRSGNYLLGDATFEISSENNKVKFLGARF